MASLTSRPAIPFTLPNVGNNTIITDAMVNGFQDTMTHLSGRGGHAQTAVGRRVNNRSIPIVGVIGNTYPSWYHGETSVDFQIPIGGGIDTIEWFMQARLLGNLTTGGQTFGGAVNLELVLNGVAKSLIYCTWQETNMLPLGVKTWSAKAHINNLFRLPINEPCYMALVLTFSTCEFQTAHYGSNQSGFQIASFYEGVNYFGFSAYRDCEKC